MSPTETVAAYFRRKIVCKLDALGLNADQENLSLGFLKLVLRHFIYICKLKEDIPKMPNFLHLIKHYSTIEKEIISTNDFITKWKALPPTLFK